MYLLNRDQLGGQSNQTNSSFIAGAAVAATNICTSSGTSGTETFQSNWCNSHAGPSYFVGRDGAARIVSSGNTNVDVWKLSASSGGPGLVHEAWAPLNSGAQDPGFFTSVSSNGQRRTLVWAVQRPNDNQPFYVWLYAIDPRTGNIVYRQHPAGTWPNLQGTNANIVPVVADGRVFVASFQQLNVFGFGGNLQPLSLDLPSSASPAGGRSVHGTILEISGSRLRIKVRSGATVVVDTKSTAFRHGYKPPISVGSNVGAIGSIDESGVLQVQRVYVLAGGPSMWPSDK